MIKIESNAQELKGRFGCSSVVLGQARIFGDGLRGIVLKFDPDQTQEVIRLAIDGKGSLRVVICDYTGYIIR